MNPQTRGRPNGVEELHEQTQYERSSSNRKKKTTGASAAWSRRRGMKRSFIGRVRLTNRAKNYPKGIKEISPGLPPGYPGSGPTNSRTPKVVPSRVGSPNSQPLAHKKTKSALQYKGMAG